MDEINRVQLEVRLALLEKTNKILVWIAGALLAVVIPSASFIMASSNKEVELATKIRTMENQITELTKSLNLTNDDLGQVQTWAEQIFVSKEVFEASKKYKQ